ncbi:MAG: hypothetical protein J5J00_02165 [Deltaproteobacteria bacterium]|nr:hypothetical protein [Deltaproteobacteria bacterium]
MAKDFITLQEISAQLRMSGDISVEEAEIIRGLELALDEPALPAELTEEPQLESPKVEGQKSPPEDLLSGDVRAKIRDLEFPQKIKVALYGNSLCRSILISDASRLIQLCVLKNPKITLGEVEEFCKNPNVSQVVLRHVSDRREWMKEYSLKLTLVNNPKTPGDIAVKWIKYINLPDLKKLSKSKAHSNLVVNFARKRVMDLEQGR